MNACFLTCNGWCDKSKPTRHVPSNSVTQNVKQWACSRCGVYNPKPHETCITTGAAVVLSRDDADELQEKLQDYLRILDSGTDQYQSSAVVRLFNALASAKTKANERAIQSTVKSKRIENVNRRSADDQLTISE